MNNAVYCSLMEQARFCYFRQLGLLRDGGLPFVLAELTVRYLRPGRIGMVVETAARVTGLGRTSLPMDYEVRTDTEVLANGSAVLVYVDGELRPMPVDPRSRACLREFEGLDEARP